MALEQHVPTPHIFREKIGDREYEIQEKTLDAFNDVVLWSDNPRLIPYIGFQGVTNDDEMEASLQRTNGYGDLRKSIKDVGQLEPIYVWKNMESPKYLVLEGATRVTILRDLARTASSGQEDRYRRVKAKVLPADFPPIHRIILLARIHVRGSGVRSWGRYVEAKYIHDNTAPDGGEVDKLSISEMARWMGKSGSWVSRLRDAYAFARQFVDYLDSDDAEAIALDKFSILEEIIKAPGFGPQQLKGDSAKAQAMREEVFEMVKNDVFKEYRDARFMKQFFEDPEKWDRLKSHERYVANQLANELKAMGPNSLRGRLQGLYSQMERAFERDPEALDASDLEELQKCVNLLASHVAADVGAFRLALQTFVRQLYNATLNDVTKLTPEEYHQLLIGVEDLRSRVTKYAPWSDSDKEGIA